MLQMNWCTVEKVSGILNVKSATRLRKIIEGVWDAVS